MPLTRHKAALRRAEGHPPSPHNQDNIPRELRERPQRRKKRATRSTRSTRSTATPESEEEPPSSQDQLAPAQALREGNAGGYVRESTSEHQEFPTDIHSESSIRQPERFNEAQEPHGSNEATTTAVQDLPDSLPLESLQTPPRSPTLPHSSPVTSSLSTANLFRRILSKGLSTPGDELDAQTAVEQATATVSVSPQTDGHSAATAPPAILGTSSKQFGTSVHTAATQTSLITLHTSRRNTKPPMRTISVQTDAPAYRFRHMGLYTFRSELAVPPGSSTITLHLGNEREIRISQVSPTTLGQIKEVLHDRKRVFERNWLTPAEAAAESAAAAAAQEAEKQDQLSAKRKRDNADDDTPTAQRRRIEPAISPTPLSALSTMSTSHSRLGSRFRRNGRLSGRHQAVRSSSRSGPASTDPPAATDSTLRYGTDGGLRLLRAPGEDHQETEASTGGSDVAAVTTGNDSDDEDESSFLQWPTLPYWSIIRNPPRQAVNTSNQTAAIEPPPEPVRELQDTAVEPTGHTVTEEPGTSGPETPQPTSWGLGSIFSTARRYIPGILQRQAPSAVPQTIRPAVRTQDMADNRSADMSQRGAQTEPRQHDRRATQVSNEATSSFAQRLRDSQSATKQTFRSKENIEEIKRVKAEKERLAAEWAKLEEERKITEQERKDVEDAHRAAYASQQPGSKRPRRPSPRVIPNPKGVTYGLDPAYFDSSDEDEEQAPSPTRIHPMRKARRLHGPDHSQVDERIPLKDSDGLFTKSARTSRNDQAIQYQGSHFSDSPPNAFQLAMASRTDERQARKNAKATPTPEDGPHFNHRGHFQVPLSPSSSEEDEAEESSGESPSEEHSVPSTSDKDNGVAQDAAAKDSDIPVSSDTAATAFSTDTNTQQPEPTATPKPAPRAVRFANDADPSETLMRNRQILRDKMLLQGGKVVPSPQDIAGSLRKTQSAGPSPRVPVTQPSTSNARSVVQQEDSGKSRAPVEESLFVEPGAPTARNDFSIRGAASRTQPKSPARRLAETLPTVYGDSDSLHAYEDFQQEIDPTVRGFLESSWESRDDGESADSFMAASTVYCGSEQPVMATPAISATRRNDNAEPYVDDTGDAGDFYNDDYGNDNREGNQVHERTRRSPDAVLSPSVDSAIAGFLENHWTPEDEAYASDEFKDDLGAQKGYNVIGPVPGSIAV
ncbi:MAG: hypothetical protein L6R39_005071 [Caloplaca ligustica]|nr:MAG: hypothetical protein L6R39_005071 [Caloplaca ligustica]